MQITKTKGLVVTMWQMFICIFKNRTGTGVNSCSISLQDSCFSAGVFAQHPEEHMGCLGSTAAAPLPQPSTHPPRSR